MKLKIGKFELELRRETEDERRERQIREWLKPCQKAWENPADAKEVKK